LPAFAAISEALNYDRFLKTHQTQLQLLTCHQLISAAFAEISEALDYGRVFSNKSTPHQKSSGAPATGTD